MNKKQVIFLLLYSLIVVKELRAETPLPKAPAVLLLPWEHLEGVNEEFWKKSKPQLEKTREVWLQSLQKTYSQTKRQTLLESHADSGKVLSQNQKERWKDVYVVPDQSSSQTADSLTLQPLFCSLGDRFLSFFITLDTKRSLILNVEHRSFEKKNWEALLKSGRFAKSLEEMSSNSFQISTNRVVDEDALQLTLSLGSSLPQTGAGCLQLLLAQQLSNLNYHVTRPFGSELNAGLRDVFFPDAKSRRGTRHLTVTWEGLKSAQTFPLKLAARLRYSESVFSFPVKNMVFSSWIWSLDSQMWVTSTIPEEVLSLLKKEKLALATKQDISVLKVYGAWVYLNQGRASGLKMGDRLVSSGSSTGGVGGNPKEAPIKGHVIGFYGPGENLKHKQTGEIIPEGAILFIRKGQRKSSVGQIFVYDQTTYR